MCLGVDESDPLAAQPLGPFAQKADRVLVEVNGQDLAAGEDHGLGTLAHHQRRRPQRPGVGPRIVDLGEAGIEVGGVDTQDDHAAIGMDMTGFMMEMPLLSMLLFEEKAFSLPAEELVDHLLSQTRSGA